MLSSDQAYTDRPVYLSALLMGIDKAHKYSGGTIKFCVSAVHVCLFIHDSPLEVLGQAEV